MNILKYFEYKPAMLIFLERYFSDAYNSGVTTILYILKPITATFFQIENE